jgi:ATP-dependent Lon protease
MHYPRLHEVSIRELGQKITSETQQRMSKAQRDFFLREQLRSIQHELGEGDDNPEIAQLRQRLEEAALPNEARRGAERELDRLAVIPPVSPEYGLIRTYLDWVLSLPWNTLTGGDIDVRRAREVLDADHYDLDKIKDRILEHLAVEKLRKERVATTSDPVAEGGRGPILCFVGPPGVGKTSLGQSIARALQRKFIGMSLGGVRDEPSRVTAERVEEFLGRASFFDEVAERTERPGVAVGLAWTPSGGDVLFVEAAEEVIAHALESERSTASVAA